MKSKELEDINYNNNFKPENIIWEVSKLSGEGCFIIGGSFLSISILGLFYFSFLGIPFLILSLLLLRIPKKNLIRFTDSELVIKKRVLGRTKRIDLTCLSEIVFTITKRSMYHSKIGPHRTYNAWLNFKLRVFGCNYLKNYNFQWRFNNSFLDSDLDKDHNFQWCNDRKQRAIEKRIKFENKLEDLEKIFPDFIHFKDNAPPNDSKPSRAPIICCITFIVIIVIYSIF